MKSPKKILVIRNDKIGDFMLAWPAFALLKKQYLDSEITALVPEYTAPLAEQCEWIDKVLIDTKSDSFFKDVLLLSKNIKINNYDISISLFSELRTSLSLWLASVPIRIGPSTKLAQIFLNRTQRQKRSQSLKPEYEYNLDLIAYLLQLKGDSITEKPCPPYLSFTKTEVVKTRTELKEKFDIDETTKLVFIHPGTGGSAINISIEQYAELIQYVAKNNVYIVITAGPGEYDIAKSLSSQINKIKHHIHHSTSGLIEFCKLISTCDLFIGGSTGPLHIAGALNILTAGFYPAKKSATSLRWQTLNSPDKRLSFSPPVYTGINDMSSIDIRHASDIIINRLWA